MIRHGARNTKKETHPRRANGAKKHEPSKEERPAFEAALGRYKAEHLKKRGRKKSNGRMEAMWKTPMGKKIMVDTQLAKESHEAKYGNLRKQDIDIGNDLGRDDVYATILTLAEMNERLVFIGSVGAVVDRKTGRARKKDIAKLEYCASMHKSGEGKKAHIQQALPLWMKTPGRLSVDVLAWSPGQPEFCVPPETSNGAKTRLIPLTQVRLYVVGVARRFDPRFFEDCLV